MANVAAVGTLATVLVAVLADNAPGLDEVESVVAAVVTAAGTVYGGVANAEPPVAVSLNRTTR